MGSGQYLSLFSFLTTAPYEEFVCLSVSLCGSCTNGVETLHALRAMWELKRCQASMAEADDNQMPLHASLYKLGVAAFKQ